MKAAISGWLFSALFVFCSITAAAQTTPPVSGATIAGTFSAEVVIDDEEPGWGDVIGEAQVDYIAWLTSQGETVFSVNVNTMTFTAPCAWAGTIPLKNLMSEVAVDGLAKAIQLGFISCTLCPTTTNYKVYYPTCVNRNTSGSCPVLTAATNSTFSYNTYSVCCTSGAPTISFVSASCGSTSCGTGYDLTCY